jgi:hypothetical protein
MSGPGSAGTIRHLRHCGNILWSAVREPNESLELVVIQARRPESLVEVADVSNENRNRYDHSRLRHPTDFVPISLDIAPIRTSGVSAERGNRVCRAANLRGASSGE